MKQDENVIRRAVLVIHGIGQQRKYQTLSEFALGLIRHGLPTAFSGIGGKLVKSLKGKFEDVGIELFEHGPVTLEKELEVGVDVFGSARDYDSRVTLKLPEGASGEPSVEVDIYESYWAYITGGRTNVFRVIWWLIVTTFRAVSNIFVPIDPISYEPDESRNKQKKHRRLTMDFIRELSRFLLALGVLLLILYGLYAAVDEIVSQAGYIRDNMSLILTKRNFIFTVLLFFYIYFVCQFIARLFTGGMKLHWIWILAIAVLIEESGFWIYGNLLSVMGVVFPLISAVILIVIIKVVFVDYLGDIEIYISGNDIGGNRQLRREIIERACDSLEYILEMKLPEDQPDNQDKPYYNEVIVVGHSLGSVIAYDVLCRMLRLEGGTKALQARARVKHFFTAGSPLDKIWYFFRDRSSGDNPLYQGILGKLKGVKATGIISSPLAELEWTNIWTFTDIVSGGLEKYGNLVKNIHLYSMLFPPFANHVMYWRSWETMRMIGERIFRSTALEE